jgi:hypothetical protein
LALHFFPIIPFGSITLLTGMTGISLHMQWPLTSQSNANSKALIINKNLTELNPLALCCLGYLQTKCPASKHSVFKYLQRRHDRPNSASGYFGEHAHQPQCQCCYCQ